MQKCILLTLWLAWDLFKETRKQMLKSRDLSKHKLLRMIIFSSVQHSFPPQSCRSTSEQNLLNLQNSSAWCHQSGILSVFQFTWINNNHNVYNQTGILQFLTQLRVKKDLDKAQQWRNGQTHHGMCKSANLGAERREHRLLLPWCKFRGAERRGDFRMMEWRQLAQALT